MFSHLGSLLVLYLLCSVFVTIYVQGQYVLVYNGPSETDLNYVNVSGIQGNIT